MSNIPTPGEIVEEQIVRESDNVKPDTVESSETPSEATEDQKPTETPDQKIARLEKLLKEANHEAGKYRIRARETQEKLDASKSPDEVEAIIAEHKAELDKIARESMVLRIGRDLPENWLKFVQGDTEDEIATSVAELLEGRASSAPVKRGSGGLSPKVDDNPQDKLSPSERAARIPLY